MNVAPIQVRIQEIAFGGDGVGRVDGQVVFIPETAPGELVEATPVEQRKGFIRARIHRVLEPSAERVTPPCRYFGVCGGCAYQHLSYPAQLEIKRGQMRQVLRRIGRFEEVEVHPVVPSPKPYGFRNRITVHARDGALGFYEKRGARLVDIERCELASDELNLDLTKLRARRPRDGHYTIRERSGRAPFEQTNDGVAQELLQRVAMEGSQVDPARLAVDAYCGSGFFAHKLAERFGHVIGIDWSRPAIDKALASTPQNAEFWCGDAAELLEKALGQKPDLLVLDPPAEGVSEGVIESVRKSAPGKIVYISCDPATFSRDARRLCEGEMFRLAHVTPFDMFPQTSELELVAVFFAKNTVLTN